MVEAGRVDLGRRVSDVWRRFLHPACATQPVGPRILNRTALGHGTHPRRVLSGTNPLRRRPRGRRVGENNDARELAAPLLRANLDHKLLQSFVGLRTHQALTVADEGRHARNPIAA